MKNAEHLELIQIQEETPTISDNSGIMDQCLYCGGKGYFFNYFSVEIGGTGSSIVCGNCYGRGYILRIQNR